MTVPTSHVKGMLKAMEAALHKLIDRTGQLEKLAGEVYVADLVDATQRQDHANLLAAITAEKERVGIGMDSFDTGAVAPPTPPTPPTP